MHTQYRLHFIRRHVSERDMKHQVFCYIAWTFYFTYRNIKPFYNCEVCGCSLLLTCHFLAPPQSLLPSSLLSFSRARWSS